MAKAAHGGSREAGALSHHDVVFLAGEVDDEVVSAIVATGATYADVESAVLWASGSGDLVDRADHPLEGAAAAVYDILMADPLYAPEEEH